MGCVGAFYWVTLRRRDPMIAPRSPRDAPRSSQETPRSRPDGQDASKIALREPPYRNKTPPDRSKKPQERSKSDQERPRGLLERSWGHLAAFRSHLGIKNVCFSLRFPILFVNSCFYPNIASEGTLEPNLRQLGSSKVVKSAPRAAKRPSRGAQERPRAAQE